MGFNIGDRVEVNFTRDGEVIKIDDDGWHLIKLDPILKSDMVYRREDKLIISPVESAVDLLGRIEELEKEVSRMDIGFQEILKLKERVHALEPKPLPKMICLMYNKNGMKCGDCEHSTPHAKFSECDSKCKLSKTKCTFEEE